MLLLNTRRDARRCAPPHKKAAGALAWRNRLRRCAPRKKPWLKNPDKKKIS
jgi:hypothetical protein